MNKNGNSPSVFISYSQKNKVIADDIESAFKGFPLLFKRDIRDVKLGMSFKAFMNSVNDNDYVLMIVSEEFLKSRSCMYEVIELINFHQMELKILPIITENANGIFDDNERLNYYTYWKNELTLAESRAKKNMNSDYFIRMRNLKEINNKLDLFFEKLLDLRSISFNSLKQEKYKTLIERVGLVNPTLSLEAFKIWMVEDKESREILLNQLILQDRNNKDALLMRAFTVGVRGEDLMRTKYYYEEIVERFPPYYIGILQYAIYAHDYLKDYRLAKSLYEKCISVDAEVGFAHSNYARLLSQNYDDFGLAKSHYEMAFNLGECMFMDFFEYARILDTFSKDYSNAVIYYSKTINNEYTPNYLKALSHYYIAKIYYEKTPNFNKAEENYLLSLKLEPSLFNSNNDYGHFLLHGLSEYSKGEKYLLLALEQDPNSALVHNNLGYLYMVFKKEIDKAIFFFEKSTQIEPDEKVYFNIASMYDFYKNDYLKASLNFEKAIELNPNYSKAHFNYCLLILKDTKSIERSRVHYEIATKVDSTFINKELDLIYGISR